MPFIDELLNYKNDIFIETGTYQGDTINRVVNNKIYKPTKIISLELSDVFFNNCIKRFQNNSNIQIYKANSKYELYNIIKDINCPITFWLDSHWSGVVNIGCDPETLCPILYELEQIKQHPIKTHTIMIDDIRLMDNIHFPVSLEEITKKILEINPNYVIKYYDDYTAKNDILVAYIEDKICIHKYLTTCKTNLQPPGFGDFLRGTIALYNFSELYNYKLYIDSEHPIFNFLKPNTNFTINNIDTIELLSPLTYPYIYDRIKRLFESNKSFSIMTNSFYTIENNKLINYGKISNNCKNYLKNILSPSIEIENKIKYIFDSIYNIDINSDYKIIHLRLGDNFLHNNLYNNDLYNTYYQKIYNLVNNNINTKYILISDSSYIANQLKLNIKQLYYWDNLKIHLGDLKNNSDGIFDTLIDFFIISRSKEILSNGSGFSIVISEIYDIKYIYI